MLGIKNYNPTFYKDINMFIQDQKAHLRALIGLNIDEVWTVHEASDGELWADCPVIISVEGKHLEFCSFNDNEIAVTWNEIDLKKKLDWYGNQELNLEWRKNELKNITPIIGKPIEVVEVIEMKQQKFGSNDNLLCSNLLLNGLGFDMGNNYFSIFNAFDETGFSYSRYNKGIYTKV
ncbi:hypothetical protein E3U55_16910 [Filobacillus milosensis]|uniref:Uncharacterized protein n=1 Tax=Filobacillus milosensis TaxID=94137 RepID=A0A4Y8IH44_9BACI|nr:hypothetical protein [Filobacillus milosensis]TFB12911.1 hypothetical protein E3U55_16910 [Filobacillus milosensis]